MVGKKFFYIALGIFATGVALIGVFFAWHPYNDAAHRRAVGI